MSERVNLTLALNMAVGLRKRASGCSCRRDLFPGGSV